MRTLPLTVLAHEGPQARAYLVRLAAAGMQPAAIVQLISTRHPGTGRPVGTWLPRTWRRAICARVGEAAHHHWPRRLRREYPALVAAIRVALATSSPDAAVVLDRLAAPFDYGSYSERTVPVLADGFADPAVAAALEDCAQPAVLYTGGGIVPADLLAHSRMRFIHVHPGRLPYVRGADGVLWSLLVRGTPGMSIFYMSPGIDTGDVIAAADLPFHPIRLSGPRPDDGVLYRALFAFYDPVLRADYLAGILAQQDAQPAALAAQPQCRESGTTFHFMHERLRRTALARLFVSA